MEKEWYLKLERHGFRDIEDTKKEDRRLKQWDNNFFRNKFNQTTYRLTLAYYERAKKVLHSYPFIHPMQRKIWELHCEGMSERKIAKAIKVYKKSMVHYLIAPLSRKIKDESRR